MPSVSQIRLKTTLLRLYFTLGCVANLVTLGFILAEHSETSSAILFGYSAAKLALAAGIGVLGAAYLFLAIKAWREESWTQTHITAWTERLSKNWLFLILVGLFVLAIVALWFAGFLPEAALPRVFGRFANYVLQARVVLLDLYLLSAVSFLLLWVLRFGLHLEKLRSEAALLRLSAVILAVLLLGWVLSAWTGFGWGIDIVEWNAPGTPVLYPQVILVVAVSFGVLWLGSIILKRKDTENAAQWLDIGLFLIIWVLAGILWLRQPMMSTYYASEPVAPNYEYYPLSDARNHDIIAQNILIGRGFFEFGHNVVRRPLYAFYLTILHAIGGPGYDVVIPLQVFTLALFPALLYLLGKRLHSRLAGLLIAALIVTREINTMALAQTLNVSHSKLLLVGIPAALALTVFALVGTRWLEQSQSRRLAPLVLGGILGLSMLMRSQMMVIAPTFVAVVVLVFFRRWRQMLETLVLFAVGLAVSLSPWVLRNYQYSGHFIIEHLTSISFMAEIYGDTPEDIDRSFLPGETDVEYYERFSERFSAIVWDHPFEIAMIVSDNYVRNLTLTVMPLPVSFKLYGLKEYVRELPYWPMWHGEWAGESSIPLVLNMALVAIGVGASWRRQRWAGLFPLFVLLGFSFSLALARVSGWRYNLPGDWVAIFYYALGLAQMCEWGWLLLGGKQDSFYKLWAAPATLSEENEMFPTRSAPFPFGKALGIALAFLLVPLTMIVLDKAIPAKFTSMDKQAVLDLLAADDVVYVDPAAEVELQDFLAQGNSRVDPGRGVYPEVIQRQEGKELSIYLLGVEDRRILLPLAGDEIDFPHGSDVIAISCEKNGVLYAAAVIFTGEDELRVVNAPDIAELCQ